MTNKSDRPEHATERRSSLEISESQERWQRVRRYLNRHRIDLARSARGLYPSSWHVAGTPLLARPAWIPGRPVSLDQVVLSWEPGRQEPLVDGTEPASASVRPLRSNGTRFQTYADAVEVLDRPRLFENRWCYRLLQLAAGVDEAHITFGRAQYFDVISLCEAAAHGFAAHVIGESPGHVASMDDLPLRTLMGDPTDLERRRVVAAISTLVLRMDARSDNVDMVLHWRDPTRVASGGGLYQVAPVGIFQPAQDTEASEAADFNLWHSMTRELSEELLGSEETDAGGGGVIDYQTWEFSAALAEGRREGRLRPYWLGMGVDALSLVTDILTVVVIEAALFDDLFGRLVTENEEGHLVSLDETALTAGIPFTAANVERFGRDQPMQPAGAALLRLAWEHAAQLTRS
jgi:hypothetical protein